MKDTVKNRKKCICLKCPSYPNDCKGEILYCGTIKSKCDINAKGCICNTCPVYAEYDSEGLYFCDKDKVVSINKDLATITGIKWLNEKTY